jgi:enoyl-CoA hydratase/carnithine racemase
LVAVRDQKVSLTRALKVSPQQHTQMAMEEQYRYITIERQGGDGIYVITLRKPPENRLDVACCQELIRAYHNIQQVLGSDSEGAVILRGENSKFFCTVC